MNVPFAILRRAALAGLLALPPAWSAQVLADGPSAAQEFAGSVRDVLSRHCYECHGHGAAEGELELDSWESPEAAVADRAAWERIRRVLARREMPPAEAARALGDDDRQRLLAWIDSAVFCIDCQRPDPGPSGLRRLNRAEYQNTVRDLLGVDYPVEAEFPVDASGHGFDTMGDVLSLPPLLVEKYLTAAERIADLAIVTPEERGAQRRRFALDLLEVGYNAKQQGDGWVALTSVEEDDVVALETVKAPGEYRLRARAFGRAETPRPLELTFLLGDQPIETVLLTAEPQVYETRVRSAVGRQRFRVALRRIKDGLPPEKANLWREGPDQSGTALVEWLEVEGPFDTRDDELPAAHRALLVGLPAADGRAAAGRSALERLLPRAFRRPATSDQIERLLALAEGAWQRGASFERGIEVVLQAVLVSPAFLYRGRTMPTSPSAAEAVPIDDFALASRLSYFLWSSMPDERLFELAGRGELRANLATETARMLADRRSESLVADFFGQWLELRNLAGAAPDPARFHSFDESLREAMRRETELFCRTIVAEDRSVLEFLTADYTFVDQRLAKHYGLEGVEGDGFRRVSLAGQPRRGVLTQASILTLTSNPTRTSPVKRGKWVLENLLGAPPPPPPAQVPELEEQTGDVAGLPLRQRMELHRESPLCASCHARMDPLGFALENFDAIGAWRTRDGGAAIDAAGELAGGEAFSGATEFVEVLARSRRDDFVCCLAEKLLTYALGRGLEPYDRCAVDAIVARCQAEEYRFSALVQGVVESVPFQKQRGAAAAVADVEIERTSP